MKLQHVLATLALALAIPLAACGDDDEGDGGGDSGGAAKPTRVAFELKPAGKKATMEGPASVKAGVARITFKNATKKGGGAQLIRIEGNHTAEQTLEAGEAWGDKGKALPEWMRLEGGVPNTGPGKQTAVTQSLAPGKYLAADIESNAVAEFEVTGEASGEIEQPSSRIDAAEYSFTATGLRAGQSDVVFDNKGEEPHFVVGLPIKPGKTIEDVKKSLAEEGEGEGEAPSEAEDPVDENDPSAFDTPVFDGGGKQVLSLELKKGKYALVCFIPDRKGGPPHVAKGMISEAVVE